MTPEYYPFVAEFAYANGDEVIYTSELAESKPVSLDRDGFKTTRVFRQRMTKANKVVQDPLIHMQRLVSPLFNLYIGRPHPTLPGCILKDLKVEPFDDDPDGMRVTFEYGPRENMERENAAGEVWELDLSAQTTNITSVMQDSDQFHYPPEADVGRAINIDGENINGVDVYRPSLSLSCTKRVAQAQIASVLTAIQSRLNTVNADDVWATYRAGELLFTGAVAKRAGDDPSVWEVQYKFLVARKVEPQNITLSNGEEVEVEYDPWDYVWFIHETTVTPEDEGGTGYPKMDIKSIHIARVYERSNFSNFNLSGPTAA